MAVPLQFVFHLFLWQSVFLQVKTQLSEVKFLKDQRKCWLFCLVSFGLLPCLSPPWLWQKKSDSLKCAIHHQRGILQAIRPIQKNIQIIHFWISKKQITLKSENTLYCTLNLLTADFVKPCKIAEKEFVQCSTASIQSLFDKLSTGRYPSISKGRSDPAICSYLHDYNLRICISVGIPGLESIKSFDPFHLNRIKITQGNSNAINLKVDLTNVKINGFGHTNVVESLYVHIHIHIYLLLLGKLIFLLEKSLPVL